MSLSWLVALAAGALVVVAPVAEAAVHEVRTVRTGDAAKPHAFEPERLTIQVGDTVRWINGDGVYHTVASSSSLEANRGDDRFGAPIGSEGETFEHTFTQVGEQRYFCQPHAGFMWGFVTVVAASGGGDNVTGEAENPTPSLPLVWALVVIGLVVLARRR